MKKKKALWLGFALAGLLAALPLFRAADVDTPDDNETEPTLQAGDESRVDALAHLIEKTVNGPLALPEGAPQELDTLSINGGGMASIIPAAQVTALHDLMILARELKKNGGDLNEAARVLRDYQLDPARTKAERPGAVTGFDKALAVSAAAPTIAYLYDNNAYLGVPIYYKTLTAKDKNGKPYFMHTPTGLKHGFEQLTGFHEGQTPPGMDIDMLARALHGDMYVGQRLDGDHVLQNTQTPLYFIGMKIHGQPERFVVSSKDMKSGDELVNYCVAACRIPGVARNAKADEPDFYDSKSSSSLAIYGDMKDSKRVYMFGAAAVDPKDATKFEGPTWIDNASNWVIDHFMYVALLDNDQAQKVLDYAQKEKAQTESTLETLQKEKRVIMFGPEQGSPKIKATEMDGTKLQKAAKRAYNYFMRLGLKALEKVGLIKKGPAHPREKIGPPPIWNESLSGAAPK